MAGNGAENWFSMGVQEYSRKAKLAADEYGQCHWWKWHARIGKVRMKHSYVRAYILGSLAPKKVDYHGAQH